MLSVRVGNPFFHTMKKMRRHSARLPLNKLLELIWLFLYSKCTVHEAAEATSHSSATVIEWWYMSRQVCLTTLELQPKFIGTHESPVQTDESYFCGRRKYNRARILDSDNKRLTSSNEYEEISNWNEDSPPDADDESSATRKIGGGSLVFTSILGRFASSVFRIERNKLCSIWSKMLWSRAALSGLMNLRRINLCLM